MPPSAQPNFFIVGAAKTGTTSLYRYLDQHPDVFMSPIKEPCFFAPEVAGAGPGARAAFQADAAALSAYLDGPMRQKRGTGIVLEWDDYLKLFRHVRRETAIGEASVSYLSSMAAARAIRARIPEARILMMFRDPAQRLFSHYTAARSVGATDRSFVQWVRQEQTAEAGRRPPFGPVWTGRYADHLQRYLDVFPAAQVRTYLYDDYLQAPTRTLADILGFLGVDPGYPIDVTRRYNVTLEPRWPTLHRLTTPIRQTIRAIAPRSVTERVRGSLRAPVRQALTADERRQAIDLYGGDIRRLATLIRRDLSAWLDPHRSI
jgi:hypothetical protein